jgi:transcriptional regulator with XRE-family HTH domain
MNQKEFSEKLGISQGTLSDIESGKCNPSFETLLSLRLIYHCDLNWLVSNNYEVDCKGELNEFENDLINQFRMLSDINKLEIMEFIKIKQLLQK